MVGWTLLRFFPPLRARVRPESESGGRDRDCREKSWERWNHANLSIPLLGFSDMFCGSGQRPSSLMHLLGFKP